MRKIKFLLASFMALFIAFGMTSCSDNDEPDQPDDPTIIQDYHFDLWVALDRHGGMGRDVQTLVRSVNSLDADQPEITFQGTGTEVNSLLSLETILKGAYYYQVPVFQRTVLPSISSRTTRLKLLKSAVSRPIPMQPESTPTPGSTTTPLSSWQRMVMPLKSCGPN